MTDAPDAARSAREDDANAALVNDIAIVRQIAEIQSILDVVCQTTGMGFAAVARVTQKRWIAGEVLDRVKFGLRPGSELPVETTLCHQVREARCEIVIDNVAEDPEYADHHTPRLYGLQSYISVPILLEDGSFFGTLCAIDAKPARLKSGPAIPMFRLFAQMIAREIDIRRSVEEGRRALADSIEQSEHREASIAVLGHDLKNPLAAIEGAIRLLLGEPQSAKARAVLALMRQTSERMRVLVDNLLDFARSRLGSSVALDLQDHALTEILAPIVEELRTAHPDRKIVAEYSGVGRIRADRGRVSQMLGNLLGNAMVHGDPEYPIRVEVDVDASVVRMSVANGGNPIPHASRENLFEPFVKGDAGGKGLGLGLYIAAQIAEAHGGAIKFSSDTSETKFTVTLPRGQS